MVVVSESLGDFVSFVFDIEWVRRKRKRSSPWMMEKQAEKEKKCWREPCQGVTHARASIKKKQRRLVSSMEKKVITPLV